MIRVCIVDDQRLMREGLQTLLNLEPDIEVVAIATDGQEALECLCKSTIDVVLMDIRMPRMDGITTVRHVKALQSGLKILMLTTYDDQEDVVGALSAGASGYLLKDMPVQEIADAIRTVTRGGAVLPPAVANTLLGHVQQLAADPGTADEPDYNSPRASGEPDLLAELTEREREVLACLATGLSNREIAERLFLTEGTVKNHVSNVIAKLGLRDRTQAALFAVRHGLI